MKKILLLSSFCTLSITLLAQWTTSGSNTYLTNTSGNVGIGTTAPLSNLEVRRDQVAVTKLSVRNMSIGLNVKARYELSTGTPSSYVISEIHDFNGSPYYLFSSGPAITGAFFEAPEFTLRNLAGTTRLKINSSGNVGIGTDNPGTFKLAVEGKIGAREVHVTNTNPWPDYVFLPSYKLKPLSEVEKFIKLYQHLPDVPSADDVKDGIELGEMNAILLQKIEELTLHLIELNKKVENLEFENKLKSNK